jgi:hypothetical protein
MKWHIICLVNIVWLYVYPIWLISLPPVDQEPDSVLTAITISLFESSDDIPCCWSQWPSVVLVYAASPGRVTLCCWRLVWQQGSRASRKRRRVKKPATSSRCQSGPRRPVPSNSKGVQATAERESTNEALPTIQETSRIPLRMVLRPGIFLTGRGIQLRPMIAYLGEDVDEYCTLWENQTQFQAAIQHLLDSPCPLCGKALGFRCIGSDRRSVIPPGSKNRAWFRVQKIECRACRSDTRILPTFCIPFKSHHAQTIQNSLENCWRRNNSYRDTTGILNQSRPPEGQYRGHTLPYEWTIWLGGVAVRLPQFLVWLRFQLPVHGLLDEYFMEQDNGTSSHRIFAVTVQDPDSTVIWNIVRVERNDTQAFKQSLQHLKEVGVHLRAITSDGWPAILRAVREEMEGTIHLLCYFHAKKNVFETLEKYRKAKKLPDNAPELTEWRRAFFDVLDAPTPKLYQARLRKLTRRVADEPILLARCKSLQKKSHYNTWRLRSPLLAATSSLVELTFKQLTRKVESLYSFRRSKCNAAQKSLIVWALVRNFIPYLPGAKHEGRSPAQLAGVDLQGLPWLQYVNLKLSEVT